MNKLKELKERVDELDLTPMQKQIARFLMQGHRATQIAVMADQPEARVRLSIARIFSLLRRPRPPDALTKVRLPKRPPHAPRIAGAALELPEHPSFESNEWPNKPLKKRRSHQNASAS